MRVLLMRHGSTMSNERHCYGGRRTDEPLSELGREQCARVGVRPEVRKVYVSTMRRAYQTASLCFPCAEIVQVPGIEEFDFGVFEGRSPDDMEHDAAYRSWVNSGCQDQCPGGDAMDDYIERVGAAIRELLSSACERGEDEVFIVAHGGTIMATLAHLGTGSGFFEWHVPNCGCIEASTCVIEGQLMLRDLSMRTLT